MKPVFADTYYYLALLNPYDDAHHKAVEFTEGFAGTMLTTDWVLTELADGLSRRSTRRLAIEFVENLRHDPAIRIVSADRKRLHRGWDLYRARLDKDWSLTDCISFVIMQERRIRDALTSDHHFEQAGFRAILK